MGNNLKYLLFKTAFGDRIYYGIHEQADPEIFDGYLGQGVYRDDPESYRQGKQSLHQAILRHGLRSFRRSTLGIYGTMEQAAQALSDILTDDVIRDPKTYNTHYRPQKNKIQKLVYQYTVDGQYVKSWMLDDLDKYYGIKFSTIVDSNIIFDSSVWTYSDNINVNIKGILQFNDKGEFLTAYPDTKTAALLLDLDKNALTKAVYRKKLYAGCYFILYNEDIADKVLYHKKPIKQRLIPVYRYLATGEFDQEFKNVTEGARGTRRTSINAIKKAIVNKVPIFGFCWSYQKADNIKDIWND